MKALLGNGVLVDARHTAKGLQVRYKDKWRAVQERDKKYFIHADHTAIAVRLALK